MTVAAFVLVAVAVVVLSLSECCLVCGLWEVSVHVFVCEYGHVCVCEMDGYCCMWVSVGVSLQAPRYTRTRNPGLHYTTHNTFAGSCRCFLVVVALVAAVVIVVTVAIANVVALVAVAHYCRCRCCCCCYFCLTYACANAPGYTQLQTGLTPTYAHTETHTHTDKQAHAQKGH